MEAVVHEPNLVSQTDRVRVHELLLARRRKVVGGDKSSIFKGIRDGERPIRTALSLVLHWRHRSLRGPVPSIHKLLTSVLMSAQVIRTTPHIVGAWCCQLSSLPSPPSRPSRSCIKVPASVPAVVPEDCQRRAVVRHLAWVPKDSTTIFVTTSLTKAASSEAELYVQVVLKGKCFCSCILCTLHRP